MPRLLVSVRNLEEAEMARIAGVDLVDLKEPLAGALGAIPRSERRRIAEHWSQLSGEVPSPQLSVALGELGELAGHELLDFGPEAGWPDNCFRYAKVGLAEAAGDETWPERWQALALRLPPPTVLVAAAYADAPAALAPEPEEVLDLAIACGAEVFLLDTFRKLAGSVFELLPPNRLSRLRQRAEGRLEFAIAGSVQRRHESRLRELQPEIVALRGAVCQAGRTSPLCHQQLCEWRTLTRGW